MNATAPDVYKRMTAAAGALNLSLFSLSLALICEQHQTLAPAMFVVVARGHPESHREALELRINS
jgi:hypothetical protein